jgi:multidrug resistance efflux pump
MTNKVFKRPTLRQRRRHLVRQLFNGWPWIVWMGAAIGVILLLPGGLHRVRFNGEAERIYEYVSPLETGRLKTLLVSWGDQVEAGQLIGELDNDTLASEMIMDQVSLGRMRDRVESIRYDIKEMKLDQAKVEAELKALEAQWNRIEQLREKNLILEQEFEDLRPQIAATKEVLTHYPVLIDQLEKRLSSAERDAALFTGEELNELLANQCRLVAQSSGVVAEVLRQPGDIVRSGDPVIRVSNVTASRIIAFMPEENRMNLAEGERCRVIPAIGQQVYMGVVKSITADIRKLPVNTGFTDKILRGRRIVVELDEGMALVPGEAVVVVPDVSIFQQWFGKKQ